MLVFFFFGNSVLNDTRFRLLSKNKRGSQYCPVPLALSIELMVTPAAQDTMRWRSSMSGPTSSSTKGMMCGFTARKTTSLLLTVSLLLVVKLTPNFCKKKKISVLYLPDKGISTYWRKMSTPRSPRDESIILMTQNDWWS